MTGEELRKHCYAMGYSDGEVDAFYDGYQQGRTDAIDGFVKAIICELKNKHTDMPIVDILGSRDEWKEKNSQYLECENLVYKIAKRLKEQK